MTQMENNYAQGLYSLAKDENLSQEIYQQMMALDAGIAQQPEFLRLLAAPNLSKDERLKILDESFRDKVHPYVLNFMKILTEKGYIRHFSGCCQAYKEQYYTDNGILSVCAVSAVALSEAQLARLTEKLEELTGKTVALTCRVDEECLGGVRLDYDGRRIDGTVKNRLDSVSKLLKNTVLL